MVDQQNEIIAYTRELHRRKEALEEQLNSTKQIFLENNKKGMDAQRFGQIAKGLHATTCFEEVDACHKFDVKGSLLTVLDDKHIAVNGANRSLDIISSLDLSLVANLDTENQMPFCVERIDNMIVAGCNQGYLFTWNVELGF